MIFLLIGACRVLLSLFPSIFAWMLYDLLHNTIFYRRGFFAQAVWSRGASHQTSSPTDPEALGTSLRIASLETHTGVSKVQPEPQTLGWVMSRPPTPQL